MHLDKILYIRIIIRHLEIHSFYETPRSTTVYVQDKILSLHGQTGSLVSIYSGNTFLISPQKYILEIE